MINEDNITLQSAAKERRALILKMLEHKEEVFVGELSKKFHTSEVTIRKDLSALQQRNLVIRTRGGAIRRPIENLNEDTAISQKSMFNFQEKDRIGKAAAELIQDGDHIMLDSGTTTFCIARHLDKFKNLTILTNAMNIAVELMKYQRFNVIILGGHLRINSHSSVGPLAISALRNFSNYKLFLGVDSFSLENGVSTPNMEEALLNQQMIQNAKDVIAVFDASKFNKRSFAHICEPDDIHVIVTDKSLPNGMQSELKKKNIRTIVV